MVGTPNASGSDRRNVPFYRNWITIVENCTAAKGRKQHGNGHEEVNFSRCTSANKMVGPCVAAMNF